jgi:hypoxanthine phosphoribosyltransferase
MPEKELVITRSAIARRIQELGAVITRDYADSRLLVIGILNGAFMFMADLVREIKLDIEVDFLRLASYGMETQPGNLRLGKDIELDITGKDILIVEDIIDTGQTVDHLRQLFWERGAQSLRFCVLIDKKERRARDVCIDYVGFEVSEGFLVGYGLDCREQYRQFAEIYRLKKK